MLGLDLYTQGCTYSWSEVCVRFRLTHTGVHLFMEGSLYCLGWTYAQGGGLLFMEGSLF